MASGSDGHFRMMTLPLETVMAMTRMRPHEELIEAGELNEFNESSGCKAMFVSHQWVTQHHPDPNMEQFGVFQRTLHNLVVGRSKVSVSVELEASFGRVKCPKGADFNGICVWYDYFSCPQGISTRAALQRQLAINSIPSYVARCLFFVILCPAVCNLSYETWSARGWCRLEQLARHLAREDGFTIVIKTPSHPTLTWNLNGLCLPPGEGDFTHEVDRATVAQVVLQMLWSKLHFLLEHGDIHKYRFLLNLQYSYLRGFVGLHPIEGLVPGFDTEIDPTHHAASFLASRFLHDSQFKHVTERDSAGWSPLCYAVLTGRVSLVKALLETRADANETTTKQTRHANISKKCPVLSLAATYHSNDVIELLLSARANVNARCGLLGTALHWGCASDNVRGVHLLLDARANPRLKSYLESSPFREACYCGSAGVIKEMLATRRHQVSLRFSLHSALAFSGGNDAISCLIEASADVNEQLRIPLARTSMWFFTRMLHLTHYVSPSALTLLAYHHYGATPLTFSILTGKFETIPILLAAGASWNIPNDRGNTPADVLRQMDGSFSFNEIGGPCFVGVFRRSEESEDSDDTIAIAI